MVLFSRVSWISSTDMLLYQSLNTIKSIRHVVSFPRLLARKFEHRNPGLLIAFWLIVTVESWNLQHMELHAAYAHVHGPATKIQG